MFVLSWSASGSIIVILWSWSASEMLSILLYFSQWYWYARLFSCWYGLLQSVKIRYLFCNFDIFLVLLISLHLNDFIRRMLHLLRIPLQDLTQPSVSSYMKYHNYLRVWFPLTIQHKVLLKWIYLAIVLFSLKQKQWNGNSRLYRVLMHATYVLVYFVNCTLNDLRYA